MNKKILRLAVPNILSNLSVPLLSAVDTAVVGHLEKVSYLGAIAIGSMIFNFIYWGFGFLRMGTTGLTAQALGGKKDDETISIFARSFGIAVISGLALIIFQSLISNFSFYLVDGSAEVEKYASEYFDIRIWAAPATLSLYAFHGWFLGMQNAKYPLILTVTVNILNIILNLTFIYGFGMKVDGVALGTVIAQYIGLGLAAFLYLKKYSSYTPLLNLKKVLNLAPLKEYMRVNFDIFIRTLSLIFAFTYFTAKSAEFGNDLLAVNTILLQLWMLIAYGVDGFAFAAESLVGKYFGAKDKSKLKEVIKYSFYWGIGFGVIFSAIYFLFDRSIVAIFTDKNHLIDLAMVYFTWTIFAPLINGFCFIWDGIFIGATATKAMRNTMLVSTFVIFLPVFLLTRGIIGNHSLWFAMTLFMITRGVTLTLAAPKCILKSAN